MKEDSHFGLAAGGQMSTALSSNWVPTPEKTGTEAKGSFKAAFHVHPVVMKSLSDSSEPWQGLGW